MSSFLGSLVESVEGDAPTDVLASAFTGDSIGDVVASLFQVPLPANKSERTAFDRLTLGFEDFAVPFSANSSGCLAAGSKSLDLVVSDNTCRESTALPSVGCLGRRSRQADDRQRDRDQTECNESFHGIRSFLRVDES